ncbi:hypothetical protein Moror_2372 [Moniliophthora roreri MCA 2997]|uniref:Uncharacterized protein n=2 Tax=Moniliophthora roreri TaxID=221103 RepID=V2WG82_MONRO|nr:hypothetical protein Moror_2372 [Moniliophthora roreri MCA 2997]
MAASRSPGLAIATAAGIAISAGAMYMMQQDTKRVEGNSSMYKEGDEKRTIGAEGDKRLGSSEVQQVISQNTHRAKPVVDQNLK